MLGNVNRGANEGFAGDGVCHYPPKGYLSRKGSEGGNK